MIPSRFVLHRAEARSLQRNWRLLTKSNEYSLAKYQAIPAVLRTTNRAFSNQQNVSAAANGTRTPVFQPAVAPSPSSLPKRKPAPSGRSKWGRRLIWIGVIGGVAYGLDRFVNASAFSRTVRSIYHLTSIAVDYKLNFEDGKDILALHARAADRIYHLITANKGLYIKFGQAVALQSAIFPPAVQEQFARLFDSAPQDPWRSIEKTFIEEFGVSPDSFFEHIDHRAVASASIAQVHKAKLKTGEVVAVKIQHADIKKQIYWDLLTYRGFMYIYEKIFDLPVYFMANHIAERLEMEVDFRNELANSVRLASFIEEDNSLKGRVYVPKVFEDYCSGRVLVAEWIEGTSLSDKKELKLKKYDMHRALTSLMNVYSGQIFRWGHVHCDPHPGNLILRVLPNGSQQLVIIDHGLYISENEKFRQEYCKLWKSMFIFDQKTLKSVIADWGIDDVELLATAVMLRPYKDPNSIDVEPNDFRHQQEMTARFKHFFKDTTKIPLELIFLGRTMRILQGINQLFGSPVNRIKILAVNASSSLVDPHATSLGRIKAWFTHVVFLSTIALTDVTFWIVRFRQFILGSDRNGMEDLIARQMVSSARQLGFEVSDTAMFEG